MKPTKSNPTLSERVITLIEEARRKVAVSANIALVYTYYEIGRMIVEEEQGGKVRAEYGRRILDELSSRLTERFGKGWSVPNLKLIRQFFITYSNSLNTVYPIGTLETQSNNISTEKIVHGADDFCLSWSHYLVLMRIADSAERQFYEHEAIEGQWSLRQLSRQIGSQLYERMKKHKDTCSVQKLMSKAPRPEVAIEPLKDPYTLEFLGLPEKTDYSETQLEQAIIDHLAEFMLELGKGFTFVGASGALHIRRGTL